MSSQQYRIQLERKRQQRTDTEKKAGEYRSKESSKRTQAAQARAAASKLKNAMSIQSKMRESYRREKEAESAGKEAGRWLAKVPRLVREETALQLQLTKAERAEAAADERRRVREHNQSQQRSTAERVALESRIAEAEEMAGKAFRALREPQSEKLRVLILGASSEGGLRVGREQKRIRAAVQSALHRDLIEIDARPAATTADLLDGITRFRPHVVHFSGHSSEEFIVFEDEKDAHHDGVAITAKAFVKAVTATDDPPLLIFLNSCESAAQIDGLVATVAPFAIGMADEVEDADAIHYASQFYAAIANGQSINAAHLSGQAALELAGLGGADLPTLAWADGADPSRAILVEPPLPSALQN